jgi:hypothetical protein
MNRIFAKISLLVLGLLLLAPQLSAQFPGPTGSTTVAVTIGPSAGLTVTNSSTPLTMSVSNPGVFTGSTLLTYYVRTSTTGGSGSITLKVTSDFSPSGGPSVAKPLSPGDGLKYTCSVSGPGTACTGTQTSSTTAVTPIASFGTNAHTSPSGSTATTNWSLANDPLYQTGSYTATIIFTISAS